MLKNKAGVFLDLLSFRNLRQAGGPGFTEAQAKVIASEYEVMDEPDEAGDMFERPGRLSDHFPSPFPNVEAAKASNNGAAPPDFSLLAKARAVERGFPTFIFDIFTQYQESGPDYIYGLLTGYTDAPEGTEVSEGTYYNPNYIGGNALAMSPPLYDEQIEYTDGSPQTVDQYARDVSAFMMWAAEPKLEERKRMGFIVMAFLLLLSGLLYLTKRKVWANIEH